MRAVDLADGSGADAAAEWVVSGLVPRGYASCLFGREGCGKSLVALWIGVHVAAGLPVFGREVSMGRVLVVDAEMDRAVTHARATAIARSLGLASSPSGLRYLGMRGESVTSSATARELVRIVTEESPDLVLVDSFRQCAMDADPNDGKDVQRVLGVFDGIASAAHAGVLLIDHSSAAGGPRPLGSVAKVGVVRAAFHLAAAATGGRLILTQTKANFTALMPPLVIEPEIAIEQGRCVFRVVDGAVPQARGAGRQRIEATQRRILAALEAGPAALDQIAEAAGIMKKTAQNRLYELRASGQVEGSGDVWQRTAR